MVPPAMVAQRFVPFACATESEASESKSSEHAVMLERSMVPPRPSDLRPGTGRTIPQTVISRQARKPTGEGSVLGTEEGAHVHQAPVVGRRLCVRARPGSTRVCRSNRGPVGQDLRGGLVSQLLRWARA